MPADMVVGVHAAHWITAGLVRGDHFVDSPQHNAEVPKDFLFALPAAEIVEHIVRGIIRVAGRETISAVGVGVPGVLRHGIVQESPNLPQLKGVSLSSDLSKALQNNALPHAQVFLFNDADTIAAGIAAQRSELNRLIRVWMLGRGIGFGRYPAADGIGEGGHIVVTLDPRENHCACGGCGHLEGIMGGRAMRLRFLDKEPEEVFELAARGDPECTNFVTLWHRALAAASASCIHLEGPGEFFLLGPNSRFVDIRLLTEYVDNMVAMSTLQGSTFAVLPETEEIGVLGAAVNASRALASLAGS